ncbi:MAG: sigma-70 family RNA polymerase sigma factor [Bacteroidia bacterium]|nr:sigma-70 family RNA polymerase sigma factor [Bacteroidia bacterium]
MRIEEIIRACKKRDRSGQKALYDRYAPQMMSICMRYCRHREDAEDVLCQGMFRILDKIDQYTGKGNFEGWMKRIIINECLMHLRKKKLRYEEIDDTIQIESDAISVEEQLIYRDVLKLLDQLPTGYRTVFSLYVIDGYKHKEIAEKLGISINTSKSQLILAKKRLRSIVLNQYLAKPNELKDQP